MESVSFNSIQNSTIKRSKVHRPRQEITRKVIAFQELIGLEHCNKSAREAANLLEIPNSTMQAWQKQKKNQKVPRELEMFFSTPVGADFLQRSVMSVMKLMKCGPSGIRGMQEYLRCCWLNHFIATSEGALQNFWMRCEEAILEYGGNQEKQLSSVMRHRKITVGLDEMYRGRRLCLVGIEVVSSYILIEKFTDDRKSQTWKRELDASLNGLNVEVNQVVSDLCGGDSCLR